MNRRTEFQIRVLNWYSAMCGAGSAMSEVEMRELSEWEADNVDGSAAFGTSDWPGWARYIGEKPTFSDDERAKDRFGYVYLIKARSGEYKVGQSKNVGARIRSFATVGPFEFELVHQFPTDDCLSAERLLHQRYSEKRIKREWFSLSQLDISDISQLTEFMNGTFLK
jgi:Meiotically up-regulated gene 113